VLIPRSVQTYISADTEYTATCAAPSVYGTDIVDGTSLSVTIIAPTGGATQATFNTYSYTVNANSSSVPKNFTDNTGTPFANIARYSCYNELQRGTDIQNLILGSTDAGSKDLGTVLYPSSSEFCFLNKTNGYQPSNSACSDYNSLPSIAYSSQAYYFNLYIQENAEGNINLGNSQIVCPQVKESLSQSPGNLGTQGKAWPLDTTFALSQTYNTSYTIGVAANTITSNGGDPTSQAVSCAQMQANSTGTASPSSTPTTGGSSSSPLVSSCLGFAAPTATNGSCGQINGYVLYPPFYDTSGLPYNGSTTGPSQMIDTIYVLDRPVSNPADPSAVITMLGPKPCPQSYFDIKGVTGAKGYYATSNAGWTNKNVDGIQFPNLDAPAVNGVFSCSATLPLVNTTLNEISTVTINELSNPIGTGTLASNSGRSFQNVYVRPVQAWSPHYVEDISFQACAPLAQPLQDPPLHFAKLSSSSSTVTWCAEAYPSQNDNVPSLDPSNTGLIAPFTSHAPQGTSVGCTEQLTNHGLTTIPSGYPPNGLANHTGAGANTCDRTVLNPAGGLAFKNFPLLAPATDTESVLESDSSFGCTLTYYNGNTPTQASPSQGCCGTNVNVIPGSSGATTAHLEPPLAPAVTNCLVPNY
jgi:hypothetical protein